MLLGADAPDDLTIFQHSVRLLLIIYPDIEQHPFFQQEGMDRFQKPESKTVRINAHRNGRKPLIARVIQLPHQIVLEPLDPKVMFQKFLTGGCRLWWCRPGYQHLPCQFFQQFQTLGDCGLGDMQRLGGLVEAALLGNHRKSFYEFIIEHDPPLLAFFIYN